MKYLIFSLCLLLTFTGCSRKPAPKPNKQHNTYKTKTSSKKKSTNTAKHTASTNTQTRLNQLYSHYRNWKGTPYCYGGMSQKGVDCSGFVYKTYKQLYNITLPRSTKDQVTMGQRVYINQLHAGDLVFFKTGWNVRHVGIYLEKGKFVHASSSKGVIVSSMLRGYWRDNYWQARRLF
jgi:cell wall-associated NlpC family hydrolase